MSARRALGCCPDAIVLDTDAVRYRTVWDSVLDALDCISPEVEDDSLGRAYVNVSGLLGHYPDETALAERIREAVHGACGLSAGVGIAGGRFPSVAAAVLAGEEGVLTVPADGEACLFAPLDISILPVEAEVAQQLRLLGLDTVGEVAAIPAAALEAQFGIQGRRLWQLANGVDEHPLKPRRKAETIDASLVFEEPVAGIDVMVAAGRQLLSRLRGPLGTRSAREISVQAELTSGRGWAKRIVLREAVSEDERLAFILRSALTNSPPPMAVRSLSLCLGGLTGESGKQLSLGQRARLQAQLEETIRQLKTRFGYSPIYRCVDVEPWSTIPEERQILVESDG
jgi:nucleotidyltransferase/DNA polymerase involved in DNA repair